LIETGEEKNIYRSHLKYFLELSEQAEPALRGPTQMEWQTRLNDEAPTTIHYRTGMG